MSTGFTPLGMRKPSRAREALVQKQWPKKPEKDKKKKKN